MRKSKEELEKEINETPYFTLTGDEMSSARETAKNKLAVAIFDYCRNYWYEQTPAKWLKYDRRYGIESEAGMAIMACLKPGVFDPNEGIPFLHYLKKSIKNAITKAIKNTNERNTNVQEIAGDEDDVGKSVESKYDEDDDSDRESEQNICDILNVIEEMFKEKQERVQPYLRSLITLEFLQLRNSIINFPRNYECIDYIFFDKYSNELEIPTQKEIAAGFGRGETDASRTLRGFFEKVKGKIQGGDLHIQIRGRVSGCQTPSSQINLTEKCQVSGV